MAESDVFEIFGSTALAPVFLTAEHAYAGVPSPLEATVEDRRWLKTHWGYDIGVRNVVQSTGGSYDLGGRVGWRPVAGETPRHVRVHAPIGAAG